MDLRKAQFAENIGHIYSLTLNLLNIGAHNSKDFRPESYSESFFSGREHNLHNVNTEIENYIESIDNFTVVCINSRTYAVKTPQTNNSSLDFVHVTRKGISPGFVCAFGSNCGRTAIKVAKKTTSTTLCVREHLVQMVEKFKGSHPNTFTR